MRDIVLLYLIQNYLTHGIITCNVQQCLVVYSVCLVFLVVVLCYSSPLGY